MSHLGPARRIASLAVIAALSITLAACLLAPGKFTSALAVRKSGAFSFTYDGEIYLLPLSNLARSEQAGDAFTPEACHDDDTFDERECTPDEIAQQKQDWDAGAAERQKQKEQEAQAARAMLGGIDPSDPRAAQEFAERLRRQAGWTKVESKGNGLFEVSFAIDGQLDHDFVFPTIEGFPMTNAFVQIVRREGDIVRIDAPSFAAQKGGNPLGMIASLPQAASEPETGGQPAMPQIDGTFTVTTDGAILANNTDEGPRAAPPGQVLQWRINQRTATPPTALIKLSR